MNSSCNKIPVEKLIAYSDCELPTSEAEQLSRHIQNCPNCQAALKALQDSLEIAQDIWREDEVKWGNLQTFEKPKITRLPFRRIASIAAGILIISGIALLCLLWLSSEQPDAIDTPPTVAQIELEAQRAAIAAQMMFVGDMYAAQPGAEQYAVQRYNDLIESFSGSPISEQAELHLQNLLERMVQ